jgi:hypothetical protein
VEAPTAAIFENVQARLELPLAQLQKAYQQVREGVSDSASKMILAH